MDALHAYVYATSFWYFLRGITRIFLPKLVITWFATGMRAATDLELYMARTDAIGLVTLSLLTLVLSDAVNFTTTPLSTSSNALSSSSTSPYKRGAIMLTSLHHAATAFWAYLQWMNTSTSTGAFLLGVVGSGLLAALGGWTLMFGMDGSGQTRIPGRKTL